MQRVLVTFAAAMLAGCAERRSEPGIEQPPPEPVVEEAAGVEPSAESPALSQLQPPLSAQSCVRFEPEGQTSVKTVRQVRLCAEVEGAFAGSKLEMYVVTPSKDMYERREAELGGTPFEKQRREFSIPVAATAIETASLSGTWTAQFYVDGKRVATQPFELTP